MPKRLDLLKLEMATIDNMYCLSFDLIADVHRYYLHEIAAIEEYGSDNLELTGRGLTEYNNLMSIDANRCRAHV